ncbi:RNA 2'-phosphotransferase [Archaeoglobus profundus]|uniref:Probable RNA 2'-phosphotransferase n=1 Tax=Archaeoglobus profundus (strain DSM 5631 / JCM 9629 / NBRC 100127 / Av18) TaxID=572546 RepID=D2RGK3_ARCPA|nr:RNA 2'-phosphotransferase [Archaeoglobus profundus]ADB57428.1 phosphotransferase KptA/Tpt1 [Archaeoglobus profundus DSM 5631]
MKPLGVCKNCGDFEGMCKCGKGKILIDGEKRERISKFLSGLLRHYPHSFGLKVDEFGWVDLKEVLKILKERYGVGRKVVELIVKFDPKGRFEIKDGKIRARYGHSIDVKVDWSEAEEIPEKLYHGTSPKNLESILKEGLKPMRRKEVHLSATIEDAIEVGRRHHPQPVVLEIYTECLIKHGLSVRKKGSVYTTDYVPPQCLKVLDMK